jgi:capsid protein
MKLNLGKRIKSAAAGAAAGFQMSMSGWRGNAYGETTTYSTDRSNVLFYMPSETSNYVNSYTRQELLRKAEWVYQNFGIVKMAVAGIARHTIGKGITLQADTDDDTWNDLVEGQFNDYALSPDRSDIARRRDFYDGQEHFIESRIWRGEFFGSHVANPSNNDEPTMQFFDTNDIQDPEHADENIHDGIELDDRLGVTRYWTRQNGKDVPIGAGDMMHFYKAERAKDLRGITELAQAVNKLVDIHDLIKLTTKSAKVHAAIAIAIKRNARLNQQGAIGKIQTLNGNQPAAGTDYTALESIYGGGALAYVGEKGEVELLTSNSPSPLVKEYITDLLMRDVCASWQVPSEFFWNVAGLGGANTRFVLSQADLFFQILADKTAWRYCNPRFHRWLNYRQQNGFIPECKDKNWRQKIGWQMPARVTVDNGRDGALELNQLSNGGTTLREMYGRRGKGYRTNLKQWFREWREAKAFAIAEGVPEAMANFRASMPGAAAVVAPPDDQQMPNDGKPTK